MKATAAIHCSIAIQLCVSWANVRVSTTLYMQGRHGWQGPQGLGLPGFCRIESGGNSGGMSLMLQPVCRPCLPKIGCGGPDTVCNVLC